MNKIKIFILMVMVLGVIGCKKTPEEPKWIRKSECIMLGIGATLDSTHYMFSDAPDIRNKEMDSLEIDLHIVCGVEDSIELAMHKVHMPSHYSLGFFFYGQTDTVVPVALEELFFVSAYSYDEARIDVFINYIWWESE